MENKRTPEQILADNLVYYRKEAGLTQLEIAEKFNYSDKSISKWERAEGIPDVIVLKALADFYGIKIDDFFKEKHIKIQVSKTAKRWFIVGLSTLLLWAILVACWAVFSIWLKGAFEWWLLFIYGIVGTGTLGIIWSSIYHKRALLLAAISTTIWAGCLSLFLSFLVYKVGELPYLYFLFLIGIPLQGLAIVWYFLRRSLNKKK